MPRYRCTLRRILRVEESAQELVDAANEDEAQTRVFDLIDNAARSRATSVPYWKEEGVDVESVEVTAVEEEPNVRDQTD